MADSTTQSNYLAGKDAAARERAERLMAAKKKLKTYRARQKTLSIASNSYGSDVSSPTRSTRRDSGQMLRDSPSSHKHRRSASKSALLGSISGTSSTAATASTSSPLANHARRHSKSRHSRGASMTKSLSNKSHGHTRSRASLSIVASGPSASSSIDAGVRTSFSGRPISPVPPPAASAAYGSTSINFGAPFGWGPSSAPSTSADAHTRRISGSSSVDLRRTAVQHQQQQRSISSNPAFAPPPPGTTSHVSTGSTSRAGHERRASRHNRQTSVSNFRESLEIVSGSGAYSGVLQPATSSFAPSGHTMSPMMDRNSNLNNLNSPVVAHHSPAPMLWSNDPEQVLAALKERGRLEVERSESPEQTRQNALEALEGRLSAPTEMIDLGMQAEGELFSAPKSPGLMQLGHQTTSSGSGSHQLMTSPVIGLGVNGKRNSWSAPGPVSAQGAIGAMGLGALAEVEEEDEDERRSMRSSAAFSTPRRTRTVSAQDSPMRPSPARSTPRKSRPSSIIVPSDAHAVMIPVMVEEEDEDDQDERHQRVRSPSHDAPSPTSSKGPRMRPLNLSQSGGISVFDRPHSASNSPELSTANRSFGDRSPTLNDERLSPVLGSSDKVPLSHFHSVAVKTANGEMSTPSPASQTGPRVSPPLSRGLRPLSFVNGTTAGPQASSPSGSVPPPPRRSASATSSLSNMSIRPNPPPAGKRSSLTYRNTSIGSLAGSEGPMSAAATATRRPWRQSLTSTDSKDTSTSNVNGSQPSAHPFGGSPFPHGGFGSLSLSQGDDDDRRSIATASPPPSVTSFGFTPDRSMKRESNGGLRLDNDDKSIGNVTTDAFEHELASLRTQLEQMRTSEARLEQTHALEVQEFENKASQEARIMKSRIAELEKQVEEVQVARRFEVEGLQREVRQAKEMIEDLTSERDSLKEDVDGWRQRVQLLEADRAKNKEDDAVTKAQAKLISDMREQIMGLAKSLDAERQELTTARNEIEQLKADRESWIEQQEDQRVLEQAQHDHFAGDYDDEEDDDQDVVELQVHTHQAQAPPPTAPQSRQAKQQQQPQTYQQQQQYADQIALLNRRHQFNAASDGSTFSTSSYGRSYSGNTTEDTSIATDVEDLYPSKASSPQSSVINFGSGSGSFKARDTDSTGVVALNPLQTLAEVEEEDDDSRNGDRLRQVSGSTGSASSNPMPQTPAPVNHDRSHSFVRQWSFPKGVVNPVRLSQEDHSFFDYNRHTSLPALPFDTNNWPEFVTSDLTLEDEAITLFDPMIGSGQPLHARRPSSPRPMEHLPPHVRRYSGQFASRAPPPAPSALSHAQLSQFESPPTKSTLSRLSFGFFGGGGSPQHQQQHQQQYQELDFGGLPTSRANQGVSITSYDSPERPMFSQAAFNKTNVGSPIPPPPPRKQQRNSLSYANNNRMAPAPRYIKATEVKRPKPSKVGRLDFTPSCCTDSSPVYVV
ncbi:hypothetical protein OIO90_005367 [Microbotryomycetes sp. JL221]|nr:hypothetical protein OIO90_005367 [Microbotryomycetes sp. JL221]